MQRRSWMLIAGLVVLGAACAHGGAAGNTSETEPAGREIRLNVTNRYALPVDVYAVAAGTSYRMGTVSPGIGSHFVLRAGMVGLGPVEFVAHPAGGEPPVRSGRLVLAPGDVVDFEIAAHLINSTATVRH